MGYVARQDSLSIQNQSHLVVVNTWNTEKDQGVIPGKVYECFLLKKPTLAITNGTVPNSELGKMIVKSGLGFSIETMLEETEANEKFEEFFMGLYDSVANKSGINMPLDFDYIEQFNYKNITNRLMAIMSAQIEKQNS